LSQFTQTNIDEALQRAEEQLEARQAEGRIAFRAGYFNESWLWLGAIFVALGLAFNQTGLLALGACLYTVIPISWLWNRWALVALDYERHLSSRRAFPGEIVELTLRVTNRKPVPIAWIKIDDLLPANLPVREVALIATGKDKTTLTTTWALRWYERVTRRYHLFCSERGVFVLGPATYTSGDAFALFTSRFQETQAERLIVFPEVFPLSALDLPEKDPFGVARSQERLFEDPARTRGVRDRQPDDSLRYVHWKASARHGKLQVRVFEPTAEMQLMVFLNVTTMPRHWHGQIPELFERAICVAASVAQYGIERAWRVGLMTNGVAPHSDQPLKILPRRSADQLGSILAALASVTSFPSASIDALLRAESPHIGWGATLVVVTAIVTPELAQMLVRLRDAGRRVVLIALGLEAPPEAPGVRTYYVPPQAAAFRRRPAPAVVRDPNSTALDAIPSPQPRTMPDDWAGTSLPVTRNLPAEEERAAL
jgi:uncharacterized repeat protein (TIGR01451 family)